MELKGKLRRLVQVGTAVALTTAVLVGTGPAASAAPNYNVKNANTGTCLDSNSAGDVYTLTCNGGANQKWAIAGGKFTNIGTKRCLASDGTSVSTRPCAVTATQQWTSSSTAKKWIEWNGRNKCLHSSGASGEHAGMRACGSQASRWTFTGA
jgi:hypothetical protein